MTNTYFDFELIVEVSVSSFVINKVELLVGAHNRKVVNISVFNNLNKEISEILYIVSFDLYV